MELHQPSNLFCSTTSSGEYIFIALPDVFQGESRVCLSVHAPLAYLLQVHHPPPSHSFPLSCTYIVWPMIYSCIRWLYHRVTWYPCWSVPPFTEQTEGYLLCQAKHCIVRDYVYLLPYLSTLMSLCQFCS